MSYRVLDRTGTVVEPHTSIFPILKDVGDGKAHLVGTGFFITTIGHFVTAKHVIFDALDVKTGRQIAYLHALHFVEGSSILVRNITRVSLHNTSDVAVGKMDYHVLKARGKPLRNRVPVFTADPPAIDSLALHSPTQRATPHFCPIVDLPSGPTSIQELCSTIVKHLATQT